MEDNKSFWQRTAKLYAPIQEFSNRSLYRVVMDRCARYLTPQDRVLELAAGSGQFTAPLSGKTGEWIATDFSENMVRELRRRCPGVHAAVADATDLGYPDRSFDAVVLANALHIMPEPEKALAEALRVLRPGGILLAPTFVYEGRPNRVRMWLTTKAGFRTYHEWTMQDMTEVLRQAGFQMAAAELLPADPLPEAFLAARKPL